VEKDRGEEEPRKTWKYLVGSCSKYNNERRRGRFVSERKVPYEARVQPVALGQNSDRGKPFFTRGERDLIHEPFLIGVTGAAG